MVGVQYMCTESSVLHFLIPPRIAGGLFTLLFLFIHSFWSNYCVSSVVQRFRQSDKRNRLYRYSGRAYAYYYNIIKTNFYQFQIMSAVRKNSLQIQAECLLTNVEEELMLGSRHFTIMVNTKARTANEYWNVL